MQKLKKNKVKVIEVKKDKATVKIECGSFFIVF